MEGDCRVIFHSCPWHLSSLIYNASAPNRSRGLPQNMAANDRCSGIMVVFEPHSMGIPLEDCKLYFLLSYSIGNPLCHHGYNIYIISIFNNTDIITREDLRLTWHSDAAEYVAITFLQ